MYVCVSLLMCIYECVVLTTIYFTYHQKLEKIKVIPEDFVEHCSAEHLFAGVQLSAAVAV